MVRKGVGGYEACGSRPLVFRCIWIHCLALEGTSGVLLPWRGEAHLTFWGWTFRLESLFGFEGPVSVKCGQLLVFGLQPATTQQERVHEPVKLEATAVASSPAPRMLRVLGEFVRNDSPSGTCRVRGRTNIIAGGGVITRSVSLLCRRLGRFLEGAFYKRRVLGHKQLLEEGKDCVVWSSRFGVRIHGRSESTS